MHEAGQRLRVELAGKDRASRAAARIFGAGGRLIEHRDHLERPMGESGHHGRRGKKHIDHHDHLARDAHAVELLLAREHVDLVVQFNFYAHLCFCRSCGQS